MIFSLLPLLICPIVVLGNVIAEDDGTPLEAWEDLIRVDLNFHNRGLQLPRRYDDAIRKVLSAVRRTLCRDIVPNDVRCLTVLQSVLATDDELYGESERLATTGLSPRSLVLELKKRTLFDYVRGELFLLPSADVPLLRLRERIINFISQRQAGLESCFNIDSCMPNFAL